MVAATWWICASVRNWWIGNVKIRLACFSVTGKHPDFQPERAAQRSRGLTQGQIEYLAHRERKNACHSDLVPDESQARRVQQQELVQLHVEAE